MKDAKISKDDVQYVARLARLEVSGEEVDKFTLQLNSILDYMDKLNKLDTTGVEPVSHVIDVCNAFREDAVGASFTQEVSLSNAPEKQKGFFRVPRIIGD